MNDPPSKTEPAPNDRPMQRAIGLLVVSLMLLVVIRWRNEAAQPRPLEIKRTPQQVELNRAGRTELMQLPGIGPASVEKILAYRRFHGGFHQADELRSVEGIGEITWQRLRPLVKVEVVPSEDEPLRLSRKPVEVISASTSFKPAFMDLIDLNRASSAQLEGLPGIGRILAQRIVEERERKPFQTIDDLRRVAGIGAKKLEQVRPFVTVSHE